MRFTIATAALVGAASAQYGYGYPPALNSTSAVETPSYPVETPSAPVEIVTKTVSSVEIYCPSATEVTQGTKTYTVTEATTLTITDCPCTVTETPSSTPAVPVVPEVPSSKAPEVPVYQTSSVHIPVETPIYPTGTGVPVAPVHPVYPTGTGAVPSSSPSPSAPGAPQFPGAASSVSVGFFAAAGGALAAFFL